MMILTNGRNSIMTKNVKIKVIPTVEILNGMSLIGISFLKVDTC